ncbi:hypothetical protein HMPREF0653_02757 [Prevotella disiens JCM 6334 = ATCC 29426]|uniref:Uncharacterized protein n=1 Tax=Prevotella disiens JCM 6334 = ATCC 29426 TaxID=1235811 RepID=A0ABP2Y3J7_9BACT|nr:hypothetical protein HMPREF0653_02757 [Prevotella disiens JCM 6334 = ATCC 29426]
MFEWKKGFYIRKWAPTSSLVGVHLYQIFLSNFVAIAAFQSL